MTLEEKLDASIVLNSKEIPIKKMGILSAKQRKLSLIVFILMLIFTIYTKFILKSFSFDILFAAIIINLITLFILKLMNKSTIALNYNRIYKFIVFLNKLCKVIIFAFSIREYYLYYKAYIPEHYTITSNSDLYEVFLNLLVTDFKFISMIGTILLFIPTFIYFIVFIIRYYFFNLIILYIILMVLTIPIINIIVIFQFIFKKRNLFNYYKMDETGTMVIVEHRKIQSYTHRVSTIMIRFLLTVPALIYIAFLYYFFYISYFSS